MKKLVYGCIGLFLLSLTATGCSSDGRSAGLGALGGAAAGVYPGAPREPARHA